MFENNIEKHDLLQIATQSRARLEGLEPRIELLKSHRHVCRCLVGLQVVNVELVVRESFHQHRLAHTPRTKDPNFIANIIGGNDTDSVYLVNMS